MHSYKQLRIMHTIKNNFWWLNLNFHTNKNGKADIICLQMDDILESPPIEVTFDLPPIRWKLYLPSFQKKHEIYLLWCAWSLTEPGTKVHF
jgi:hypothetical protein